MSFLAELRRRHVFRVMGLYLVGGWVVLQVADLLFSNFGLPDAAMRYVWFALAAGMPLAVIWGWRYDVTADGIVRTAPATSSDLVSTRLQTPDYLILAALAAITLFIVAGMIVEIRQLPDDAMRHEASRDLLSSIAVLPLDNLSGDPEQDYLSAGMHDALITSLARISSFRVISRTSTLRLSDSLSVPEIGRRLGVDKVIDGSVTRDGDDVRVIVQLIDTETDQHLWTENYVRPMQGLLDLQNEMARAIASAVQVRLTPEEQRRLESKGDVNPSTYDAYLRAMYRFRRESAAGIREGIDILADAVEDDPTSALAWSGLAYGYLEIGHSPFPQSAAVPRAGAAAARALKLDPDLAQAHLTAGMFQLYYEWNFADAEASLQRSLALNPGAVNAHYHLAWLYELFRDHDAALYHGERTTELDPLSPFYSGWLAEQYRAAGRHDEAIAQARSTLELRRGYPVAYIALGETYADLGDFDAALEAHGHLQKSRLWSFVYGTTLARAGRRDEALAMVGPLEQRNASVPLVLLHASLGNNDAAYQWLLHARDNKAGWYPWLVSWFPHTEQLREDPRVARLAADIGLAAKPSLIVSRELRTINAAGLR